MVFHEEVLGGATLSIVRLVPELERRGWAFSFWVPAPSPLFHELVACGFDVRGAPRPIAFSRAAMRLPPGTRARVAATPGYLRAFHRALRDASPGIVHANSMFTILEALLARGRGVPALLHVHEMAPTGPKGKLALRLAGATMTHVIAVSRASADRLRALGAAPTIIYEGAPVPPSSRRRTPAESRMVVGTVAVVSRRKGSDVFVEAARLVKERTRGIEFHMVGAATDALDSAWAARVLERARDVGIAHQSRADVPKTLPGWDLFVLPSRWDPFPISMLEAMANGLPVIGSRVDGIPEQLGPNAGVLVQPEDPDALADAILSLAADPARRAELGAAARARISKLFSVERQADALDRLYREVLAGREGGTRPHE